MKKVLTLAACVLASIGIVIFLPSLFHVFTGTSLGKGIETEGMFNQTVTGIQSKPSTVYKLYNDGELLGTVSSTDKIADHLKEVYSDKYEEEFPGSAVHLGRDMYMTEEIGYLTYSDVDDQIIQYLDDNELYSLEATQVSIAEDGEVTARMYVMDEQLYQDALNEYISYFIDPKVLASIKNGDAVSDLTSYGTKETGVSISQDIKTAKANASPEEIRLTKKEILEYLEYGDEQDREYYTVQAYDTVAGVGAKNYGLSAAQVMNINRDKISSTDQVLPEGESLCVTYFESPIDIVVTKQTLRQESVFFETQYTEDDSMTIGTQEVRQEGQNGTRNALYDEKWINGVLSGGSLSSSVDTKQPISEVVAVGTASNPGVGTGVFRYPVDNAAITCHWGCYLGHRGTDFINKYERWGDVLAADTGVIEEAGYNSISGNYVIINHNNGYKSYYGHMRVACDIPEGTAVEKGQVIGHIGMTGKATGPHVHFYIVENGTRRDACDGFVDCDAVLDN